MYILLGVILGVLIYYKFIKPGYYWTEKGVLNEKSSWPIGKAIRGMFTKNIHAVSAMTDLYNKYSECRYVGFVQFTSPLLLLRDLDLIKQITIKDFDHFDHHFSNPFLSKSLVSDKWKKSLTNLRHTLTDSQVKEMYPLVEQCAITFIDYFKRKESVAIEVKDIMLRFTTDVTATTIFGVHVNSLNDPKNCFFAKCQKLCQLQVGSSSKVILTSIYSILAKKFNIRLFPNDITTFFKSVLKNGICKRKQENLVRPDLLHLLVQAQRNHEVELSDEDIVMQAMFFFFAGLETITSICCFMAYELAMNEKVQKRLQEDIDIIWKEYGGRTFYEVLMRHKYFDQVVSETLRLWPPSYRNDVVCTKNYTILSKNFNKAEVVLEKGVQVLIPMIAIHRDSRYYSEPERFDPERFDEEKKVNILPGAYQPFGAGSGNCIGSALTMIEVKTLFFYLLLKFDIIPINDTEIPLKISSKQSNLIPDNSLKLALRPRRLKAM